MTTKPMTETELERVCAERVPELRIQSCKHDVHRCTPEGLGTGLLGYEKQTNIWEDCLGYQPDCTTDKLFSVLSAVGLVWSLAWISEEGCYWLQMEHHEDINAPTPREALLRAVEQATRSKNGGAK